MKAARKLITAAVTGFAGLFYFEAWAATIVVGQRGRAFLPNAIQIRKGDFVTFSNDDGDLLHHAYLNSSSFSFDTGELEPGKAAQVRFSTAGTFTVLCGIHPKMRLAVSVE